MPIIAISKELIFLAIRHDEVDDILSGHAPVVNLHPTKLLLMPSGALARVTADYILPLNDDLIDAAAKGPVRVGTLPEAKVLVLWVVENDEQAYAMFRSHVNEHTIIRSNLPPSQKPIFPN